MPYYRRNLYVLSVAIFLAAVSLNQIIPFLPSFLKQIGLRGEGALIHWIGVVFAAQAVASMLTQPFWGKLGDFCGRKAMVLRAGICLTVIYFAMSVCNAPWQLALLRFLSGALTGFIPISVTLIATNTPAEHAPRSVATAQAASAAGLLVGPALGGVLAMMLGYRGTMRASSLAALISTLMVWLLVREHKKPKPAVKTSLLDDLRVSLRSPVQLSITFAVFLAWTFGAAINPYLTLHLGGMGAADWLVGAVFSMPAAAFILSAHRWTRFGERVGFERSIFLGLVGAGVGAAALGLAPSVWIFAVVYFIAGAWIASVLPGTAALTCTMVDESFRGRSYGIQQSAGMLGALVAPLVASRIGGLFDVRSIFFALGAALFLGAFVFRALAARWRSPIPIT